MMTSWQQSEVPVLLMSKLPLTLLYVVLIHVDSILVKVAKNTCLSTLFPECMKGNPFCLGVNGVLTVLRKIQSWPLPFSNVYSLFNRSYICRWTCVSLCLWQ